MRSQSPLHLTRLQTQNGASTATLRSSGSACTSVSSTIRRRRGPVHRGVVHRVCTHDALAMPYLRCPSCLLPLVHPGSASCFHMKTSCPQRLSSAGRLWRRQHAPYGFLGWVLPSSSVQRWFPMVCRVAGAKMGDQLLVYRSEKPNACVACRRRFQACSSWTAMCCHPRQGSC
jgi:hypothetical protein